MEVSINKELENYIKEKVDAGLYKNTDEVIEEALLLLKEADEKKATFKSAVKAGYDDYKAGRLTDKSPKEIFNNLIKAEKVSKE